MSRFILLVGCSLCLSPAYVELSQAQPRGQAPPGTLLETYVQFDIRGQPLGSALLMFSRLTSLQISVPQELIEGKSAPAVIGIMLPVTALDRLLAGLSLHYRIDRDLVIIQRGAPPAATGAGQGRPPEQPLVIDEIFVTGIAGAQMSELDSSLAVTIADTALIERKAAKGTADLLEIVPGFFAEDSGGEVSNNLSTRGLNGGQGFTFIGLLEDGMPLVYRNGLADSLVRIDETVNHLEVIRGGSSGIRVPNAPAAVVNLVTRTGSDLPEGEVKLTAGSDGYRRVAGFYSGPVARDWYLAAGGYFGASQGERPTGFLADQGGAARVTLSRLSDRGELHIRGRFIDENDVFYAPIPLADTADPRSIPGFDAHRDSLVSPDYTEVKIPTPGGERTLDLRDGVETKLANIGFDFRYPLSPRLTLAESLRYTKWTNDFKAVFNGDTSTLRPAASRLLDADAGRLLDTFPEAVSVGYVYTGSGRAIAPQSLASLNGNGLVAELTWLNTARDFEQIANDLSFIHTTEKSTWQAGTMLISARDRPRIFNSTFLTDIRNNPQRLDIVAFAEDGEVVGQLTDQGFLTYVDDYANGSAELLSGSVYALGEFKFWDNLRFDIGIRHERLATEFRAELTEADVPLLVPGVGEDNILANDSVGEYGTGRFLSGDRTLSGTSWTFGFNHRLGEGAAIYGRYTKGVQMPPFGSEIGAVGNKTTDPDPFGELGKEALIFSEIGARYYTEKVKISATAYFTRTESLFSGTLSSDDGGETEVANFKGKTASKGIEFDMSWRAFGNFSVDVVGVVQDAQTRSIGDRNFFGNREFQVVRTPNVQARITPTYTRGRLTAFLTYHYFGKRFNDFQNTVELAPYFTLDAGVDLAIANNVLLQIRASNLTNELGLTEGNARDDLDLGIDQEITYARPIFDRSVQISLNYSFF